MLYSGFALIQWPPDQVCSAPLLRYKAASIFRWVECAGLDTRVAAALFQFDTDDESPLSYATETWNYLVASIEQMLGLSRAISVGHCVIECSVRPADFDWSEFGV